MTVPTGIPGIEGHDSTPPSDAVALPVRTIGGGSGDGAILDGVSSSIKATVKDYANSNPVTVINVDTNGDPASVGGGTQYDQGTVATATDKLSMAGAVRKDAAAVDAGVIDGDRVVLSTDSLGRLRTTGADTTQPITSKTALTASAPAAVSVGVASAAAVAAAATRKGLILTNTSQETISIAFGAAAVLNSGITLFPGGIFKMDEYSFSTAAVNAIASAAASNLAVQEFTT